MFYCKDATEIFLEKESVDLFFTLPPYYGTLNSGREAPVGEYGNYEQQMANGSQEEYLDRIIKVMKHMEHALKPTGSILIGILSQPLLYYFISSVMKETSLLPHHPIIWEYGNMPNNNEPSKIKHNKTQVYFLHFSKGSPKFKELEKMIIDIPWQLDAELINIEGHTGDSTPLDFCNIIVSHFSEEGDTVADIMGGTGSVAHACINLNRNFIYNDVSEDQVRIAKERIRKAKNLEGKEMSNTEQAYTPKIEKEDLAPGLTVYKNIIPGYEQLIPYIEQVTYSGMAEWSVDTIAGNYVQTMSFPYPQEFKDPNDFSITFQERVALVTAGFLGFAEKDYVDSNALPQKFHDQIGLMRYSVGASFPISENEDKNAITVMYFLNDDYSEGALEFPELNVTYKPKANEALIFPSGSGYEYSISKIDEGTKYAVITYIRMRRLT